jgi:hypothetical protein
LDVNLTLCLITSPQETDALTGSAVAWSADADADADAESLSGVAVALDSATNVSSSSSKEITL